MDSLTGLLLLAARHGRVLLVAGLLAGLVLPGVALAMKPWLKELVALLIFLAALRVGPERMIGAGRQFRDTLFWVLLYQLALPLLAIGGFAAFGLADTPVAMALVLMLAAASISGSPNLAVLTGADPAPAFRLLILGTMLLPLTVIPVFWLMPALGDWGQVLGAAGRLLLVLALAGGAAVLLRLTVLRTPTMRQIGMLDGLSALAMAVIVVGLMSAAGPALLGRPVTFLGWLALALAANFGLQMLTGRVLRGRISPEALPATAIVAGNRNIALFLVALSPEVTDQVLIFIGCYQIPMYTTPLVLRGFYRRMTGWASAGEPV